MCGICGIVNFEDKQLVRRMIEVIRHRGPDDWGIFSDRYATLGNVRLSIIDVKGGHQPIHNEDETVWITYNGEIYNYLGLREKLEALGHKFYTNTDTEVVLHAYEEYGDLFVDMLRGMFAFAIWDCKKKRLLLARDRLGIKPLYYKHFWSDKFLFGSEIKSILQYRDVRRKVNLQALHEFLTLQYVPGPKTMFEGIEKLQPGHILIFQNNKIEIKKYWDININPAKRANEKELEKYLLKLLTDCVKMRLMSEVPLGVYLSGGIDSSVVTALMSQVMDEPVKTFTVGFGHRTDELKYAKIIAEHFDTDHHEIMVNPNQARDLPKVVWHFDEPVADPAALPTYLMSKLTKKYVTVVLVGEGGDETFAGYPKYRHMMLAKKYHWIAPSVVKKNIAPKVSSLMQKLPLGDRKKYFEFVKEFSPVVENDADAYMKINTVGFDEEEKRRIYSDEISQHRFEEIPLVTYLKNENESLFKRMLGFDIKVWLCDRLLMKVDKMTMASSIEARVPLLDHKLMEIANRMPIKLRLEKRIFKKCMSKILPNEILKRKKHGFALPISSWFESDLKEIAEQVLSNLHREEFFKESAIKQIMPPKIFRHNHQLWSLLIFDLWYKIYIENENLKNPQLSMDALLS